MPAWNNCRLGDGYLCLFTKMNHTITLGNCVSLYHTAKQL